MLLMTAEIPLNGPLGALKGTFHGESGLSSLSRRCRVKNGEEGQYYVILQGCILWRFGTFFEERQEMQKALFSRLLR